MDVIGISGKKQSGKTTIAKDLETRLYQDGGLDSVEIVDFADSLKGIVLNLLCPIDWDIVDIDKNKDTKLPYGGTVRGALQYFGTDLCRGLDPNCWVNAFRRDIQGMDACFGAVAVIVGDVRFPNEVKCIQELGGHVIRLLRCPFPEDIHESEIALDAVERWTMNKLKDGDIVPLNVRFDAIVDNREMSIKQQNDCIWKLINDRGWV